MKVLVDTPLWSLALRRRHSAEPIVEVGELASLIQDGRVAIIGPIRQELLSGVKTQPEFERLREHMRAFPDTVVSSDDYEEAARFFNLCRAKGIQGSNTDFLICAVAVRNGCAIFSTDADFGHFASVLPIALHRMP